jgi:hypothetical protein
MAPDEGDIGEREANRMAKRRGSANPEGNMRDKSPATKRKTYMVTRAIAGWL